MSSSSSSGTDVPSKLLLIENSHLIQVYSNTLTTWRGVEWFSFTLDVKIHKTLREGENHDEVNLQAIVESCGTDQVHWRSDKLDIKFEKHALENNPSKAHLVQRDPWNTLHVSVHKDLFKEGDKFQVIIATEGGDDIVFGASQPISVTDLALSIQERFSNHEGVVKVDNNNFVYYNKMPGANSGLEIAIKLLDENGKPSSRKFPRIDIETELVYENGIRAPIQPIKPLKLKAGKNISHVVRSEKPIFERLDGEPWLGKKKNSTFFSFVLNEVTYHHHGHDGFKVRASVKYAEDGQKVVVHPAVMNEIITVLSKPKTVGTAQNMQDGGLKLLNSTKSPLNASKKRKSIFQGEDVDDRVAKKSNRPTKIKKEELEQIECIKKANWNGIRNDSVHLATKEVDEIDSLSTLDNQVCSIAISKILHCYKSFGKCSSCLSKIPVGAMCRAIHHSVNCKFAEKIIPLFGNIDPIILQLADEVSMGSEVTTILESESFEECSKAYIANAPFEVFDASIFNTTMSEMDTSHFAPNNNARMCFSTEMTGDYSERTLQFKLDNEDIEPDDIVPMGDIYSSKFETFRSFNGAEVETLEKDKIVNIPYKYTQSDNATCALQFMPEESLLTSRFKAPDMERGRFNSDDTIAGGNAYISTSEAFRHLNGPEEASLNQDDMLRNNSHLHNQASDFLSFLDHVSKAIN